MTYWATLWYAGAVVLQLGYDGQTLNECEALTTIMERDIVIAYENQETMNNLATSMFPENKFSTSCETEVIDIDENYMKR